MGERVVCLLVVAGLVCVRCCSRLFVPFFCDPPGSGRGVALGGCLLAACAWCFAGSAFTIGLSCDGAVCCGVLCSGGLGVGIRGCMAAWLWAGLGDSAWAGVVGAAHGLGLLPLVGGLCVSLCA